MCDRERHGYRSRELHDNVGASNTSDQQKESSRNGDVPRINVVQPIASDDVAAVLADVAVEEPVNGTVELAGPEPIRLDELVRRFLSANRDARKVTTDVHALYFGIELNDQSLTPGDNPRIGPTRFGDWLSRSIPQG